MTLFKRVSFVPILALAMLMMMLRPLLMAKVFSAEDFGAYSFALLVSSTFCILGCMGFYTLLQRSMPMDIINGRERIAAILTLQCMILAVVSSVVVLSLLLWSSHYSSLEWRLAAVGVLHGLIQQIFLVVTVESRSRGDSLRFANQNLVRALALFSAAWAVALWTDSPMLVLLTESFLAFVIAVAISHQIFSRCGLTFFKILSLALKRLDRLDWRSSLSLLGATLMGFVLTNADRWIAASFFTREFFAIYAFAWIILAVSQSIQAIINSSLFPAMARTYARKGRLPTLKMVYLWGGGLILTGVVGMWPAVQLISWAVAEWFSDYRSAISIIPIFYLLAVVRVSDFWTGYLVICSRERVVLLINVVIVALGLSVFSCYFWAGSFGGAGLFELAVFALSLSMARQLLVVVYSMRVARQ